MITLDLNSRAYQAVIDYVKSVSDRGAVVNGSFVYQVANNFGRGIIKANLANQTISLEDSVDSFIAKDILNAAKSARRAL